MFNRVLRLLKVFLSSIFCCFMLSGTANAGACQPLLVAEVVCDENTGLYVINYTSTAWEGNGDPLSRENPNIGIYLDKVLVENGAYTAPTYSFSGTLDLPVGVGPGDTFGIGARALASWGDGTYGGQTTAFYMTVPTDECATQATGRFTGGGHQLRFDGVRVTRGFTLHCDLLLSNNLEINWNGNHFHIDEHLATVSCTDDPDIIQAPPEAPVDTIVGIVSGSYNNESGYTGEFTFVDAGEPGDFDQAAFKIYETANPANIVLEVPLQYLDGGNIQAHYDQPHK